jgi:NAD-dependent dihydropyrimidine dehydrogenase PreA subunit
MKSQSSRSISFEDTTCCPRTSFTDATKDEVEKIFTEVMSFWVDPEKCQACMICARKCPVEGIIGGKNQIHVIDQELCIRCGTCFDACPEKFDAVCKITGQVVPAPIPEEERTIERKGKEAR